MSASSAGVEAVTLDTAAGSVATVLRIAGDIDLSNAADLRDDVDRVVAGDGGGPDGPVLLDLSGVTFMDSQGLWLLSDLASRHGGAALAVVAPHGTIVGELLAMTRMDDVVTVHASLEEAVGRT